MQNSLILLILVIFLSCDKEKTINSEQENAIDFFNSSDLGAFGSKTRLIIYSSFDECGEWGGHKESFEIYSKKDRDFYTLYKRTKVNCDDIAQLYGKREFQQPYITKEIKLSDKEKMAINNYLSKLVVSKIREKDPGNSGQNFGVCKTDSTLIIDVYDNDTRNLENYNELLNVFNLKNVEYKRE